MWHLPGMARSWRRSSSPRSTPSSAFLPRRSSVDMLAAVPPTSSSGGKLSRATCYPNATNGCALAFVEAAWVAIGSRPTCGDFHPQARPGQEAQQRHPGHPGPRPELPGNFDAGPQLRELARGTRTPKSARRADSSAVRLGQGSAKPLKDPSDFLKKTFPSRSKIMLVGR